MSDSPVYGAEASDAMYKATVDAMHTFKFMWREMSWEQRRVVPGVDAAGVKIACPVKKKLFGRGPETEFMWITLADFDGADIRGYLMNTPRHAKGLKEGDGVSVPWNEMADWFYAIDGKVYGGHTMQVLRANMNPQERLEHDQAWGFTFAEPGTIWLAPRPVERDDGQFEADSSRPVTNEAKLEAIDHPASMNAKKMFADEFKNDPGMIDAPDDEGWTMLQREALAGNATLVYVLLKHGADRSLKTPYGETALELAKRVVWPKVIEVLER